MGETLSFSGFYPETLEFLKEVRARNSKSWFEENRPEYQRVLLGPLQALVRELGGLMVTIDPLLETRPAVGKTISRIFRDTRFSRDKTLFRDHLWFSFKRAQQDWQDTPGFFFEINPDGCCYGMGFYLASRETLEAFRKRLAAEPDEFRAVIAPLVQGGLKLEGEKYKRLSLPDLPPELLDWYVRKSFYLIRYREPDSVLFSSKMVGELMDQFSRTVPLYQYLWEIIALKGVAR